MRGRWIAVATPTTTTAIVGGWGDHARLSIQASPDYFVWWYTVKSMLLVGAIGTAAYFAGKAAR